MNKNQLLPVIRDQRKSADQQSMEIPRQALGKVQSLGKSGQVVVVSGVRRCGKSTLLNAVRKKARHQDYYVNFDDDRLIGFGVEHFQMLYELLVEEFGEQKCFYFDEIQNVPGWERFVRRLKDQGDQVFITGSNANLLSRELGTHLTGRYVPVELFPISFKELVDAHGISPEKALNPTTTLKGKLMNLFRHHLNEGGFPEYLKNKQPEYLKSLYESILYRDIMTRHKLTNERVMKSLVHYIASNIGKEISFSKMKQHLGLGSASTVKDYFDYIESTYLAFTINKYDQSVKRQILAPKKAYMIDLALAQTIGFRFTDEPGRMLENVVLLELKRRGKQIFYHQGARECDFVIQDGLHIRMAIQVTQNMDQAETRNRELSGLLEALECYRLKEGWILTHDEQGEESAKLKSGHSVRIHILPVWKWLLE